MSVADDQYAFYGSKGYTGSFADRQRAYLSDLCGTLGKVSTGSIADLMSRVGWDNPPNTSQLRVMDAIKQYPSKCVNIGILGASVAEGWPVSFDKTIPQVLATRLRQRYGLPVGGRGFIGIPSAPVVTNGIWPWVHTFLGGNFDTTTYALAPKHRIAVTNTTGMYGRYLCDRAVTSFDIHHYKGTSGAADTGYYKIDGGAAVNVPTDAAVGAYEVLHVASPATTSIEVGKDGAGATFLILAGVREFSGDENSGIQCHNLGFSGATIDAWLQESVLHPDAVESLTNLNLDLLILQDFPGNDGQVAGANLTAAAFKPKYVNLVAAIRAAGITCPIVLSLTYDPTKAYNYASTWAEYRAVIKEIVAADATLIFFDHSDKMPGPLMDGSAGLYGPDNLHTNTNGAALTQMVENYLNYLF